MIRKLLIANRGEIACRVIRTARRLGIMTVAVYSDADAQALHVRLADIAVRLGPAPARESYLDIDRVIGAAVAAGAEAIHPGYGFLSENAEFAAACVAAGLVFVGPPAAAIRAMGGKSEAKALMMAAGVPVVPGYHGENQSADVLLAAAESLGYPVLLKASAGGGGKGMRIVRSAADFPAALDGCRREAASSFGNDRILVERYLERPRHVEVQVFADRHGHCLYLHERDCSLQRRHQKVIEEAPAPGLSPAQRRAMGEAAVAAARAVDYVGAGTVEFILATDGTFHFMEMNTRLQVEHPVTEMITGLDLVEWQLRVAAGEPLPLTQEEVPLHGHAFEARVYAEAPAKGFLPSTGRLLHLRFPEPDDSVRIDSGVEAGDEITPWYDPMIAKVIVHGADRESARRRLDAALAACEVAGPEHNVNFLRRLLALPDFAEGRVDTGLIERAGQVLLAVAPVSADLLRDIAARELTAETADAGRRAGASTDVTSPWAAVDGWRLGQTPQRRYRFRVGDEVVTVVACADVRPALDLTVVIDGAKRHLFHAGEAAVVERVDPLAEAVAAAARTAGSGHPGLRSPMPGRVVAHLVEPGQHVASGKPVLVMEAMKMEHTLTAPTAGIVRAFRHAPGEQVTEGVALVDFDADPG
ncbi:MAG: acetyl/propionyl/methylcrotonyl-CoA carboxylase subunit alpha [Gammaproteobacteria bacterium]